MKDTILSKLKGVMNEDDLTKFEGAIKEMVDDKVKILSEAEKVRIEKLAEEYTLKEVESRVQKEKAELIKEYDEKLAKFEANVVDKLDLFLEAEINKNISDDMISKIAINETYKPLVEDIMALFEQKYVALDSEGFGILKEAKGEIEKLEEEVSQVMAEKIDLVTENDKLRSAVLFQKKTEGLMKEQKEKIMNLLEGKGYDEVKKTIGSVIDLVVESEVKPAKKEEKKEEKMVVEAAETDDTTTIEETVKPKVKKEYTMVDAAADMM